MWIISRYILRHFLPVFALALGAFVGLYLIIDFFEKMDDILGSQASFVATVSYFVHRTPLIVTQGIPLAVLLSALITLGILKRNRELIALRAAGVSPYVYAGPIIVMALLLSVGEFWMEESVARPMNKTAERIWDYKIRQHEVPVLWSQENVWYWGKNAIYHIRLYDQRKRALEDVSLFYLDARFNLKERIDAKQILWREGRWVAEQGVIIDLAEGGIVQEWFDRRVVTLPETPEDFKSFDTEPEDLSWLNLYHYTGKLRQEGYASTPYEVELQRRVAFPLTTLILALLGINMALRQGLHGGIATGALLALLLAFVYLTLSQLGCSLAVSGVLPPIVGVWAVNLVFAAFACYLWVTNDQ